MSSTVVGLLYDHSAHPYDRRLYLTLSISNTKLTISYDKHYPYVDAVYETLPDIALLKKECISINVKIVSYKLYTGRTLYRGVSNIIRLFFNDNFSYYSFLEKRKYKNCLSSLYISSKAISISQQFLKQLGVTDKLRTLSVTTTQNICYINMEIVKVNTITLVSQTVSPIIPLIVSFDIEVESGNMGFPDPFSDLSVIRMISLVSNIGHKICFVNTKGYLNVDLCSNHIYSLVEVQGEIELIGLFMNTLFEINPHVVTGYNIYSFDWHFLNSKLKHNGLTWGDIVNTEMIYTRKSTWSSDAKGDRLHVYPLIPGIISFDMLDHLIDILDKSPNRPTDFRLDTVSNEFLGLGKTNMSLTKLLKGLKDGIYLEEIAIYCIQDSELVIKLMENFNSFNYMMKISELTGMSPQDVVTTAQQKKLYSRLYLSSENLILDPPLNIYNKGSITGAYVYSCEGLLAKDVCVLDFKSLYPSIVLAYNVCPSTLQKEGNSYTFVEDVGTIPKMVNGLLTSRDEIKQNMKDVGKSTEEIRSMDAHQLALKILANSVIGSYGAPSNEYISCHILAQYVISKAVDLLKLTILECEKRNYKVLYGDTDSVMVEIRETDIPNLLAHLNLQFPTHIELKLDYFMEHVLFITKKKYAFMVNGKLHTKGCPTNKGNYCTAVKLLFENVYKCILANMKVEHTIAVICKEIKNMESNKYNKKDLTFRIRYKADVMRGFSIYKTMYEGIHSKGKTLSPGQELLCTYKKEGETVSEKLILAEDITNKQDIDIIQILKSQAENHLCQVLEIVYGIGPWWKWIEKVLNI